MCGDMAKTRHKDAAALNYLRHVLDHTVQTVVEYCERIDELEERLTEYERGY